MFEMSKKDQANATASKPSESDRSKASSASSSARPGESAVIGHSIHIDGDLRGEEDLRIEGDISGTIQLPNHSLTIGKEGRVKANAYAKSITVDGQVDGDLYGSDCVTIRASARVTGNVLASRVSVEEGAHFKGSIDMDPESVEAALGKKSPAQASVGRAEQSAPKPANATGGKPVGTQNVSGDKKPGAEHTH